MAGDMEHVPFQYEIGRGRLPAGDDVWSDLIQATNGLERGNLPYCSTWVHRSLHAWLRLATMAREEGRNRKRGKWCRPCFGHAACAFGLVRGGGRQEALTQNISHARGITRPMFLVASCMRHRSLSKRKGTLHATHTPGSARRPAAQQKFEVHTLCMCV